MSELDDDLRESMRLDRTVASLGEDNDRMGLELKAAGLEIDQLHTALDRRLVIGQAQGIVMARLDVEAEQAMQYLKRVSMQTNRKVADIAAEIAATRQLPAGQ